jgi:hypothetical protein
MQVIKCDQEPFRTRTGGAHSRVAGHKAREGVALVRQFPVGDEFQQRQRLQGHQQQQHQALNACRQAQKQGQGGQTAPLEAMITAWLLSVFG